MAIQKEVTHADTGYAWDILLGCCISYMILSGTAISIGILYTEFLAKYDTGSGNTAWIISIQQFLLFALGSLSNYLSEIFSFRKVVISGGILMSCGYFLSAFVSRLEWLYFTLGITAGLGGGLVLAPCTTIVNFYFKRKKGLANGLVISGGGIGSFILPYYYRYIIDEYGLQGAMLLISALVFHICAFGGLLRQPQDLDKANREIHNDVKKQTSLLDEKNNQPKSQETKKKRIIEFSLLRSKRFCIYTIAITFNLLTYPANLSALPAHMISLGFGKEKATISLSMVGAFGIFSRYFFGWITDLNIIDKTNILISSALVSGLASIVFSFFRNYPAMVIYGCVVGILPSAFFTLLALIMLDCVQLDRLPSAMGLLCLMIGCGMVIGQPILGWIQDATGSWDWPFRVMGCINILSSAILFSEKFVEKVKCHKEKFIDDL